MKGKSIAAAPKVCLITSIPDVQKGKEISDLSY